MHVHSKIQDEGPSGSRLSSLSLSSLSERQVALQGSKISTRIKPLPMLNRGQKNIQQG